MRILLLAVLISAAIVGWTASPPRIPWSKFWESSDFWATSLPAWLQGVATLGAAYIAWVAYSTWREQDTWRRRAEFADQILRSAYRLTSTIDEMRGRMSGSLYGSTGPKAKDIEVLANDPRRAEEIRRILEAGADLRSHVALATRDFGQNVTGSMLAVASLAYHVTEAHRGLQDIDRMAMDLNVRENKEKARKYCAVMGVHFYDLAIDDPALRDLDEFGDMQMLFMRGLEQQLLQYR